MTAMNWFEVDKDGLSQIVQRNGLAWCLYELVQNALDQNATKVEVRLDPVPGSAQALLSCEDNDPSGFERISLAWTLFGSTSKRLDPTKAGRFTIGEKLVLSLAYDAVIETTSGTVKFDRHGRHASSAKRQRGSRIEMRLPMTRAEQTEVCRAAGLLIPRLGVELTFNGKEIPRRRMIRSIEVQLPTELAGADGVVRRTNRKTRLDLYEPLSGEKSSLYELGIPVVETGDSWHVVVNQRVPLNMDRDNVTPAYLREVRTAVINAMHQELPASHAARPWVSEALGSKDINPEAVKAIVVARHGEKAVIADPSDREADGISVSKGYQVIHGGSYSAEQWANIKRSEAMLPAGQVNPSPKPWSDDPNAPEAERLPESELTDGMRRVAKYVVDLGRALCDVRLDVEFYRTSNPFAAAYARRGPTSGLFQFNVKRLGRAYFEYGLDAGLDELNRLIIHELGHHLVVNHLSSEYHEELCRLGARFARLVAEDESFRERFRKR